jgi:hypothetical protein
MDSPLRGRHYGGVKELGMKFVSRRSEPAVAPVPEGFSSMLRKWAQSLYDKAHDPAHCSRCGVYLPARDRICAPCATEGDRFSGR